MIFFFIIYIHSVNKYEISIDLKNLSISGNTEITQSEVRNERDISLIEYVFINNSIPSIGKSAFKDFSGLLSIHIPSSVKIISEEAFMYCTKLKKCTFSEGVEIIQGVVFFGDKSLESLHFPASVKSIDFAAMTYDCPQLRSFSFDEGNLYYTTDDNNQFVLNKNRSTALSCVYQPESLTLPSYVEVLGSCFANNRLREINFYLDSKLRIIGSVSFRKSWIKKITLPSSVEEIRSEAFWQSSIQSITLSESLFILHSSAFSQTTALSEVIVPPGNKAFKLFDGVVYDTNKTQLVFVPSNKKSISLPDTLKQIGDSIIQTSDLESVEIANSDVFSSYKGILYSSECQTVNACPGNLSNAIIHSNCSALGSQCFKGCRIRSISFEGNSMHIIGYMAFQGCSKLTSFPFDLPLTKIGSYSFSGCTSLKGNLVFSSILTEISDHSFSSAKITSANFSECTNLKSLPSYLFQQCSLSSIILPPNLELISASCFSGLPITSIKFNDCLSSIKKYAFSGCSRLIEIESWGSNLKEIGEGAFASTGLTEVVFPPGVKVVSTMVFSNCKSLKTVSFGKDSNMTRVQINAFKNTPNLHTISFPPGMQIVEVGTLLETYGLKHLKISESNSYFVGLDGLLLSKNRTVLFACAGGVDSIRIPPSVKSIRDSTFYGCSKLKSVTFEETDDDASEIEEISKSVFYGCSNLRSIQIPRSVRFIRESSFFNCTSLAAVSVSGPSALDEIGLEAFKLCSNLASFVLDENSALRKIRPWSFSGCSSLRSFRFPQGVEELGAGSFRGCSLLDSVQLPMSLKAVGDECFAGCDGIKSIAFCGMSPVGSESVFSDAVKSNVIAVDVPMAYSANEFCGIPVHRVFDEECKIPTFKFSFGSEVSSRKALGFASALWGSEHES